MRELTPIRTALHPTTRAAMCVVLIALVCLTTAKAAQHRTALVIGNAVYADGRLRNPVNDAIDMAAMLKALGFDVMLLQDVNHQKMEHMIATFTRKLRRGGLGFFYFAGHGVQVRGQNYLIPVDAQLQSAVDVKYHTVHAGWVLESMADAGNALNIIVLDACRDNPFTRRWRSNQRGLAVVQAGRGSLVAYATEPGGVAADGEGRNGTYTKHLLRHMATPGLAVELMFKRVRMAVVRETQGKQIPWESSSLIGEVYLVPPVSVSTPSALQCRVPDEPVECILQRGD